jgi:predicted HAD superfamily Cof-like phosphohydrolase
MTAPGKYPNHQNSETIVPSNFEGSLASVTPHWVHDNASMHAKFGVNTAVRNLSPENLKTFLQFRLDFLQEELNEAKAALASGKPEDAEDVVDAMIDLCVVAIGTLDAFDVDSYKAWTAVHVKNMEKEVGIKPGRPNPLGLPDLIKPAGWTSPTHADNVGILTRVFGV